MKISIILFLAPMSLAWTAGFVQKFLNHALEIANFIQDHDCIYGFKLLRLILQANL